MSSKTRDKLIDVARQLFIRKGVENTSISDIATASDKGRRTIYTYFSNKKEIYRAVLESESEKMVSALRQVCVSDLDPRDKLVRFFEMRFNQTRASSSTFASLKSVLKWDFNRSEQIRKKAIDKEQRLLMDILDQGVDQGVFDEEQCSLFRNFALTMLRGIDILTINEEKSNITGVSPTTISFINFLSKAIAAGPGR